MIIGIMRSIKEVVSGGKIDYFRYKNTVFGIFIPNLFKVCLLCMPLKPSLPAWTLGAICNIVLS